MINKRKGRLRVKSVNVLCFKLKTVVNDKNLCYFKKNVVYSSFQYEMHIFSEYYGSTTIFKP